MPTIITSHLDDIAAICRANGIQRLYVFGSAAQDTFDPEKSDLDFQVDLGDYDSSVGRSPLPALRHAAPPFLWPRHRRHHVPIKGKSTVAGGSSAHAQADL